jgi:hypothetical protein
MREDALEKLRAENPVPELLPGLPIDVIRQRLDDEPPIDRRHARRPRLAFRFAPFYLPFAATCVVGAIVFAIANSVPTGSPGGFSVPGAFSVAYAKAAIRHGEQALSGGHGAVLYTQVTTTISGPRERTTHSVQRMWEGGREWRTSSSSARDGDRLTDVAFLGGITAYYVPSHHTLYVNRPQHAASISGVFPDPDPVELAMADVSNVKPPNTTVSASSFADAVRQLMALPGAHVKRSDGLLTISVTRADHSSTIVTRLGTYKPVLIRFVDPGPPGTHVDYVDTWRFSAYKQPLPAAAAAKAFNLLRVYPHAKVVTTHHNALHLP